jgi:hypothetical protein
MRWWVLAPGVMVLLLLMARLEAGAIGHVDRAVAPGSARQTAEVPEKYRGFSSELYAQDENWLCRPDLPPDQNDCFTADLDTTVIARDGSTSVVQSMPVSDAPVDCFYIYPTVPGAQGEGPNDLDMAADKRGEVAVLHAQFARFREVCNTYAPLYRQVRFSAIGSASAGPAGALAYGDVRDAFAYYMAHFNQGRPIILIGHSQGAVHVGALLRREFDDDPDMRSRLVAAYLIGGRVGVPADADVGGDLQHIPLCRSATQTGCVVAYVSYAATDPPARGDRFGLTIGRTISACVNPAAPGGGRAVLTPYMRSAGITAPDGGRITTPWVSLRDGIAGECVQREGFSYLEIGPAQDGDPRHPEQVIRHVPGWGLHLSEVNLTMGNLLDLVRSQAAAFRR